MRGRTASKYPLLEEKLVHSTRLLTEEQINKIEWKDGQPFYAVLRYLELEITNTFTRIHFIDVASGIKYSFVPSDFDTIFNKLCAGYLTGNFHIIKMGGCTYAITWYNEEEQLRISELQKVKRINREARKQIEQYRKEQQQNRDSIIF